MSKMNYVVHAQNCKICDLKAKYYVCSEYVNIFNTPGNNLLSTICDSVILILILIVQNINLLLIEIFVTHASQSGL